MSERWTTGPATNSKHWNRYGLTGPVRLTNAEGAWVYSGSKRWVDLTSGLGAVIFGHQDQDIEAAIMGQLARGFSYPLQHPLEDKVAEQLCRFLGWGDRARFSKNGRDATVAACRLARAVTGKDMVLYCDYHGADDLFLIEPPKNGGVTWSWSMRVSREGLTESILDEAACVILEPWSSTDPTARADWQLYDALQGICRRTNTLLILDEMVSFGRCPHGAAIRGPLAIRPDLWVGGKCLANGLPLTAIVGPAEYMDRFGEDVFHSMTHAGEAVSLAASSATLERLPGIEFDIETDLGNDFAELVGERASSPYPTRFVFPDMTDRQKRGLMEWGVLCAGYANLTLAHARDDEARRTILKAFEAVL